MIPFTLIAQTSTDVPLKTWAAPLFWQPTSAEIQPVAAADQVNATIPTNSLVFVGMTPCRVIDTRNAAFGGAFGPPSLVGGAKRTFPVRSSVDCSIPPIAQAYSFNVTIVPPGFVDFVSVGPTPIATPPTFSTLNGYVCAFSALQCVISNAAIVPAGTVGSVDVYASQNTHLIIDINGYYAPLSGITLGQGTATSPSLSFNGDFATGIFSSGAGTLNISTGGTNRLTVLPNGDVDLPGNILKNGTMFLHSGSSGLGLGLNALNNTSGIQNTATGDSALGGNAGSENTADGAFALSENTSGNENTATGNSALALNTGGSGNTADGRQALLLNTSGNNNTSIGTRSGYTAVSANGNTTGSNNTFIGSQAGPGVPSSVPINNATAIGANAVVSANNSLVLGSINGINGATADTHVGIGTTTPNAKLTISGSGSASAVTAARFDLFNSTAMTGYLQAATDTGQFQLATTAGTTRFLIDDTGNVGIGTLTPTVKLHVAGLLAVNTLGAAGSTMLCRNSSLQLSTCSSSIRYKTNLNTFSPGIDLIRRLQPVSFDWKQDGTHDFGLVAEDVANVEPLLVTHNDDGDIEGVKYDRVGVVLVNAVKEQQAQIEEQKKHIAELEERLTAVEALLSGKSN
jgi:endosialidase-like protein